MSKFGYNIRWNDLPPYMKIGIVGGWLFYIYVAIVEVR